MSLIVVGNGPNVSSSSSTKGTVISASSHVPTRPPPAHVTQLTSSPHVVQHHPPPAPPSRPDHHLGYPTRPLPLSPQRASHPPPARHRANLAGGGRAAPCLPQSPLPYMIPSPAHQLMPATSVNSPSLIPQNIPPSFLPHLSAMTAVSGGQHSPQLGPGYGLLPSDSTILPPNAFKKLTRNTSAMNVDDDVEVNDPPPNIGRRSFVSPRQRDRRNYFSSLALQDHNYCAPPLVSPPRSPTPPPSPYSHALNMGVQPSPSHEPPPLNNNHDQSFTFGIAGFHRSAASGSGIGGPSVGAYPSPHYSGAQAPMQPSPLSRLKQTIHEAGVGPMTPLGEEESPLSGDKSHESQPSLDGDGGEETETAPEADDETVEDSVTRCICDFLHDDGYMICCDKCTVWQHVVCMGLDKNNIPEEYLCEKCQPRPIDKKRAKNLQRAREKEIFARLNFDSSDDEKKPPGPKSRKPSGVGVGGGGIKKSLGTGGVKKSLNSGEKRSEKRCLKKTLKKRGTGSAAKSEAAAVSAVTAAALSSASGAALPAGGKVSDGVAKKLSPRKGQRRKSSVTDVETEEENANDTMSLRSWIDTYEEAVTNHYSPELRARLQGAKFPNNQFKPKDVNGIRCNVSLRGNGMKVLTANSHIPANTPVIECRGKYMLASQVAGRARGGDFVLYHRIAPDLEVCVESKTYGNDSRFCRRADTVLSDCNAEVKHHLDKGSLHLYIVSTKVIEKNQEILLPPEIKNGLLPPLSIKDELRQIKKVNGLLDEKKAKKTTPSLKRRVKREIVKKEQLAADSSSEDDMPVSLRKTRSTAEKSVNFDLKTSGGEERERKERKEEVKQEEVEEKVAEASRAIKVKAEPLPAVEVKVEVELEEKAVPAMEKKENAEKEEEEKIKVEPVDMKRTQELKIEIKEDPPAASEEPSEQNSSPSPQMKGKEKAMPAVKSPELPPLCSPAAAKSPGKPALGLPDQSGLIVGVNTINYDVALRNKSKTREEKKMEMILKAIEAMERAEARKRSDPNSSGGGCGESFSERSVSAKRRRSSSAKKECMDSPGEMSSGDDDGPGESKSERMRKGRRRRRTTLRRRSRIKSGDSTSAMSADEGVGCGGEEGTPNADSEAASTPGEMQPFKFPRHKKQLASESVNPDSEDVDDDVSSNYLRGSRSPPGIANHLLRSAINTSTPGNYSVPKSPTKSIGCSAKKRWLRAAMSEDHSEEGGVCGAGGASPEPDCTPLKKRRLATYTEAAEPPDQQRRDRDQETVDNLAKLSGPLNDKMRSLLPNGLKERLISNLVLDAVLDKAIEDALPKDEDAEATEAAEPEPATKPPSTTASPHRKKRAGGAVKRGKGKKKPAATSEEEKKRVEVTNNGALPPSSPAATDTAVPGSPPLEVNTEAIRPESAALDGGEVRASVSPSDSASSTTADRQKASPSAETSSDDTSEKSRGVEFEGVERAVKPAAAAASGVLDTDLVRVSDAVAASVDKSHPEPLRAVPEDRPPAPMQHSVFKSFFSTDLSIDDIDRQIEAKRMEWARESAASRLESPIEERSSLISVTSALASDCGSVAAVAATASSPPEAAANQPLTPVPKKRVTIADYKKRREASRTYSTEKEEEEDPRPPPSYLSMRAGGLLPSLTSLPELPGLEARRSTNHRSSPHKTKESSPKRGLPVVRKHEKWESKSKGTPSKVRPDVTSSSSLKKTRSLAEPASVGSHRLAPQPHHQQSLPPLLIPVPAPVVPVYAPRPPIPTPDAPREDLTERLRKEFGLSIEDSEEGEEGSDTEPSVSGAAASDLVSGYAGSANNVASSAHSPPNHVVGAVHSSAAAGVVDTNHGWAPAGRSGGTTANHGGQSRIGGGHSSNSSSGHSSPSGGGGGSNNYWADVNYRNSFR